jgi:hypothetical protein
MMIENSGHVLSEIAVRTEVAKLEINVIYTDRDATLSAVRDAARLATSLHARIRIVLPAIVPYPLTLDESPVCEGHHRRLLRTVADGTCIETVAEIVHCREYADLSRTMPPHSIVVIGRRRRWCRPWSVGNRLERALSAGGHNVIRGTHKEDSHA